MKITRAMIEKYGPCSAGLDLFDKDFPDGEWEVTPDSCIALAGIFPWDWLADNVLSAQAKIRYLRVLAVQRDWYLTEREKIIERARLEVGGLADDNMKLQMAHIESTYRETKAASFCAACATENANAI